jgi:hypothetical protein
MLRDVEYAQETDPLLAILATVQGNSPATIRLSKGVYEIGHFSFNFSHS